MQNKKKKTLCNYKTNIYTYWKQVAKKEISIQLKSKKEQSIPDCQILLPNKKENKQFFFIFLHCW